MMLITSAKKFCNSIQNHLTSSLKVITLRILYDFMKGSFKTLKLLSFLFVILNTIFINQPFVKAIYVCYISHQLSREENSRTVLC
uniref:Uncharacterized protein n=1 Tax=Glossina palpalis gambiensis TaxID=67801 RepID=A0A1B0BG87_9MUSC